MLECLTEASARVLVAELPKEVIDPTSAEPRHFLVRHCNEISLAGFAALSQQITGVSIFEVG